MKLVIVDRKTFNADYNIHKMDHAKRRNQTKHDLVPNSVPTLR